MPSFAVLTLSRTPKLFNRLAYHVQLQDTRQPWARYLMNNAAPNGPHARRLRQHAQAFEWTSLSVGRNASFAEGNNALAGYAMNRGATHLVLTNDDLIPAEGALLALEQAVTQEPDAIIGALLVNPDGTVNHAGHDPRQPDPHVGRGAKPCQVGTDLREVPCVTFALAVVPATVWTELGGLDEGYVYGYEDTDFCLRAREKGIYNLVQLRCEAEHAECGTRPRGGANDMENARRFAAKWPPARIHEVLY